MKPWKQYLLLNTVAVAGITGSLSVVRNTPVRVWAAVSGCAIATLNFLLYRRLNRSRTSVLLSVAPFVGLALLVAEGGWRQFVAYVALAVGALTGVIVWLAKKTIHED